MKDDELRVKELLIAISVDLGLSNYNVITILDALHIKGLITNEERGKYE